MDEFSSHLDRENLVVVVVAVGLKFLMNIQHLVIPHSNVASSSKQTNDDHITVSN